jgi:hypothetical protein
MSSNVSSQIPNNTQNVQQILSDIQSLQQIEQDMFQKLNTDPNLTSQQQLEIIENINQISSMRRDLYTTLSKINTFYNDALNSSMGTLNEQTTAINIVENELNRSKRRLEYLETQKNNKIRLVEINQYFGEKYSEHTNLMKVVIFTIIPIIILTILYNKEILPRKIYLVLVVIISFIGAIIFWKVYASIISRDNMNYDEYTWYFDPKTAPTADTTQSESDPWASTLNFGTCIGDNCCSDGLVYDSSLNKCVVSTESFENLNPNKNKKVYESFLKKQSNKYKADVNLSQNNYKAYNS